MSAETLEAGAGVGTRYRSSCTHTRTRMQSSPRHERVLFSLSLLFSLSISMYLSLLSFVFLTLDLFFGGCVTFNLDNLYKE